MSRIVRTERIEGDPRTYNICTIPGDVHHFEARCSATVQNNSGVKCFCTYSIRYDRLKKCIKEGKLHKCNPGNPVTQNIRDYFKKAEDASPNVRFTSEAIVDKTAVFLGQKNISLQIGASPELRDLLCYCFASGAIYGNRFKPLESANDWIPKMNRDDLRKKMIAIANKAHKEMMDNYCILNMPYACVALDEGSTCSRKLLDFVLENPNYEVKSYPAVTLKMNGADHKAYVESIATGLAIISKSEIMIATLTVDGGTAQEKALKRGDPASLFSRTKKNWIKKLIVIPCVCHRINNSYKSVCLKEDKSKEMSRWLQSAPDIINKDSSKVGAKCPQHCNTRWLCDFYIADFIKKHMNQIKNKVMIIPDGFEDYYQVLIIFKALIEIFETTTTPLYHVFPIISDASEQLGEMTTNKYALDFKTSLEKYTIASKDNGLWGLAYILTPKGRDEARVYLNSYGKVNRERIKFHVKNSMNQVESEFDEIIEDAISEKIAHPDDDMLIENIGIHRIELSNELSSPPQSSESTLEQERTFEEIEDSIKNSTHWIKSSIDKLNELLSIIGMPESLKSHNEKLFTSYIHQRNPGLIKTLTETGHEIYDWSVLRSDTGEWRFIADLALRLLSGCPSEASCERTITAQRMLLTRKTLRTNKDLLDAKLKLLKGFNVE